MKSDYFRPSSQQVHQVAKCSACNCESEYMSDQQVDGGRCVCGGTLRVIGESYPSSADDWDEERSERNGEWRRRY